MTNPFYDSSGNPTEDSALVSATIRDEFTAVEAGFAKLPPVLTGNAGKAVVVNGSENGLTVTTGDSGPYLSLAGGSLTGSLSVAGDIDVSGSLLVGNGPVTGSPYNLQAAIAFDPSAGPSVSRQNMFTTTLNYSGDTTNIWEGVTSFITVNGPGQANGEINGMHAFLGINAGATVSVYEGFESSLVNSGVISGSGFTGYLAIARNASAGVANNIRGITFELTNDNTTPGSIAQYYAIDNEAMQGAGSQPTTYGFIRNADSNGAIVSLGQVGLGQLGTPGAANQFQIVGKDTSGGSFPIFIFASDGSHSFFVSNDGVTHFAGDLARVDQNGTFTGVSVIVPRVSLGTGGKPTISTGTGAPMTTEPNGSLYLRQDGGANTRLYVSAGSGVWAAIASA